MLLALDTATQTASLALYDLAADLLIAEWSWQSRRRQTQDLLVTAQRMLKQLELSPQQIHALAVTTGPGSFTGVRIAISAVKGIGVGLPQPPRVVGIPTLCVTAAPWLWPAKEGQQHVAPAVCAYIQAGRGRYNWLFFPATVPSKPISAQEHGFSLSDAAAEKPTFSCQPQYSANQEEPLPLYRPTAADHAAGTVAEFTDALVAYEAACADAQSGIWLVGEPTAELQSAVAPLAHVALVDAASSLRRAGNLAHLAARYLAQGQVDDLAALQPLYLRAP